MIKDLCRGRRAPVVHPVAQDDDRFAALDCFHDFYGAVDRVVERGIVNRRKVIDRASQRPPIRRDRLGKVDLGVEGQHADPIAGPHFVDVAARRLLGRSKFAVVAHTSRDVQDQQRGQRLAFTHPLDRLKCHGDTVFQEHKTRWIDPDRLARRIGDQDVDAHPRKTTRIQLGDADLEVHLLGLGRARQAECDREYPAENHS
ncbi:MAG: hypothetical protein WD040_05080 [Anaerolineales bacterium]